MKLNECWYDYKTVIVSGASSGIGKGIVKSLIEDHSCTVIGIARNKERMEALVEELGNKAHYFSYELFDVSIRENWESFAKKLQEKNIQPDMLINNAGILPKFDKFGHYSVEYIEKAMNINFYSCVYSLNAMLPILLKSENAAVVNVASSAALCSLAGTSVYSGSKAAVKSLTDAIREEYRGRLYVGLVCPGFTKTNIFRDQKETKNNKSQELMNMVSTDCDKMVNYIMDGMHRKRSDMVFGIDAHLMDIGNKLFGVTTSKIASKVMAISGLEMFADIFSRD